MFARPNQNTETAGARWLLIQAISQVLPRFEDLRDGNPTLRISWKPARLLGACIDIRNVQLQRIPISN
jgi:hypothetical protein